MTIVSAILTAVATTLTVIQVLILRKQTEMVTAQTRIANELRAIEQGRDNRDHRPILVPGGIEDLGAANGSRQFALIIGNVGRGFAHDIWMEEVNLAFRTDPDDPTSVISAIISLQRQFSLIGPGERQSIPFETPLPAQYRKVEAVIGLEGEFSNDINERYPISYRFGSKDNPLTLRPTASLK